MMKKITLLITLFITSVITAQVNLQDFESGTTVLADSKNVAGQEIYGGFGAGLTASLTADPMNATNQVGKIETTAGGDIWKGIFVRPQTHYINLTTTKTVSVKVYSTTAAYFKGKIQASKSGQPDIELPTAESHSGSGWQTLTYTFTSATGDYNEFVLYANVDSAGGFITPQVNPLTIYIDDVTAVQGAAIPAPPSGPTTAAPPPPARPAADVVSVFSGAYTNIATNYNPGWGQSGTVNTTYDPGNGDFVMAYTNFNYQGTELTTTNASGMEFLHVDLWTAADPGLSIIQVSPINNGTGAGEVLVTINHTAGTWTSVDIPKSSFTGMTWDSVYQLKFAANGAGSATPIDIYLDNIYFHKNTTLATNNFEIAGLNVYPNPTQDSWTVKTKNIKMSSIEVFDILGKNVISLKPETTEATINASTLKSGLYFAKINTANGSTSLKLVKE